MYVLFCLLTMKLKDCLLELVSNPKFYTYLAFSVSSFVDYVSLIE